ncbi:hypothetical protein SH449x_001712 [Pirellulaceae bacterium SH449]
MSVKTESVGASRRPPCKDPDIGSSHPIRLTPSSPPISEGRLRIMAQLPLHLTCGVKLWASDHNDHRPADPQCDCYTCMHLTFLADQRRGEIAAALLDDTERRRLEVLRELREACGEVM